MSAARRDELRYNCQNYNAENAVEKLSIKTEKYNNNRYDVGLLVNEIKSERN